MQIRIRFVLALWLVYASILTSNYINLVGKSVEKCILETPNYAHYFSLQLWAEFEWKNRDDDDNDDDL